jgi:predicted DNA-binding protein (MmcQ/YjbR family)
MVTATTARTLALSYDEAEELPHFEKASFRIKKKIFATLDLKKHRVVIKLSPIDQSVFSNYNKEIIYPANGAWGKQGWTIIELKRVRKDVFKDALTISYCTVAPKKLAEKYKNTFG